MVAAQFGVYRSTTNILAVRRSSGLQKFQSETPCGTVVSGACGGVSSEANRALHYARMAYATLYALPT